MHDYTVDLRIEGRDLDVAAVSAALALDPTNTREAGQRLSETRVYEKALWGYDVHPPADAEFQHPHWQSLEVGINALLAVMAPLKDKIAEYQREFEVYLWIGHFSSSFDGGPSLSSGLLKALGEFGVKLYIDTYFCPPEG